MQHTVLQHIVLDSDPRFSGLYSREDRSFPVNLKPGEDLDLCTHFNYVPSGKISEYCSVKEMSLVLEFDGELTVTCRCINENSVKTQILNIENNVPVKIDHSDSKLIGFVLRAGPSGCLLRSGKVVAYSDNVRQVCPAMVICTFHKEDVVKNKIVKLRSAGICEFMKIIVVDNGQTLEDLGEDITLVYSPNYGGSSGYTRGMMECLKDEHITHIILNDDDAELDPEVAFRTSSFFSLLNDENIDATIGGTMLLSEKPNIVHESGATLYSIGVKSLCQDLDIKKESNNLALASDNYSEYFGWWYFAIPTTVVKRIGLPLPMFLKYDDVEYGLRSDGPKITLCGISIWHSGFRFKFNQMSAYYAFRNFLVSGTIHERLNKDIIRQVFENIEIDVAGYRYITADTKIKAIYDFLKGPDKLFKMCQDGPWVGKDGHTENIGSLKNGLNIIDHAPDANRFLRILSLNGLFRRPVGDVILDFFEPKTSEFYRIKNILYTFDTGTGTICSRDRGLSLKLLFKIIKLRLVFWFKFRKISKQYRNSFKKYASEESWEEILGLKE